MTRKMWKKIGKRRERNKGIQINENVSVCVWVYLKSTKYYCQKASKDNILAYTMISWVWIFYITFQSISLSFAFRFLFSHLGLFVHFETFLFHGSARDFDDLYAYAANRYAVYIFPAIVLHWNSKRLQQVSPSDSGIVLFGPCKPADRWRWCDNLLAKMICFYSFIWQEKKIIVCILLCISFILIALKY